MIHADGRGFLHDLLSSHSHRWDRLDQAVRTLASRHGVTVGRVLPTVTDSYVVYVDAAKGPAVLKAAGTRRGQRLLRQEVNVLLDLGASPRISESGMLPTVLEEWHSGGQIQLTAMLLGRIEGHAAPSDLPLHLVASAITPLHYTDTVCGEDALAAMVEWITLRCNTIRDLDPRHARAIDALQCRLIDEMRSVPVVLGRVHGDYHPGNVLVDERGAISGIVDWGQSEVAGPPVADLAHWLLTSSRSTGSIGTQVARRLRQEHACTADEELFLNSVPGGLRIRPSTALLLGWLMHVGNNVTKSSHCAASRVWRWRVIRPVLAVIRQV